MKFNWSTILAPEEQLRKEFSLSKRFLQLVLVADIIGSIVLGTTTNLFAGVFFFFCASLYYIYLLKAKHYAFTDKRMVLVEAFLGTNITSIDYNQITDMTIEQSYVDQLGGWGTLVINTAGTHTPQVRLSFVENPEQIKQELDQIRDKQLSSVKDSSQNSEQTQDSSQVSSGTV